MIGFLSFVKHFIYNSPVTNFQHVGVCNGPPAGRRFFPSACTKISVRMEISGDAHGNFFPSVWKFSGMRIEIFGDADENFLPSAWKFTSGVA
jgi:hypothetical protein